MGFRACGFNIEKMAKALGVNQDNVISAMAEARVGGFARLWNYTDKGNFANARVSTSRKAGQDGNYETDFQDGFVCLSGEAYKKIKEIEVPDNGISIIITNCDVRSKYVPDKKTTYTNFYIYDFEVVDGSSGGAKSQSKATAAKKSVAKSEPADETDELPF